MADGFPFTGRGMVFAVAALLVSIGASPAVPPVPERRIEVTAGDDYYQPDVVHVRATRTVRKERPAHGMRARGALGGSEVGARAAPGQDHRPREWYEHRTHGGRRS